MKTEHKERNCMRKIRHLLSFICVLTCALLLPHSLTLAATGKTDGGNGTAQEPAAAATAVYKGVDYSRVYDYDYYTTHNSVAKRYAGKPEKAIAYFVKYGMDRQHQACEGFDVVSYRFGCPKLRKQFGTDYKKYYLHYQQTGYKKSVLQEACNRHYMHAGACYPIRKDRARSHLRLFLLYFKIPVCRLESRGR